MTTERHATSGRIAAPASAIFAIVTDPAGHVSIDGSGMLVAPEDATPFAAVGDTFVMHMDREPLGDIPLGKYDVLNTCTRFEQDRLVEWAVGAPDRTPLGHVYGWELTPISELTGVEYLRLCADLRGVRVGRRELLVAEAADVRLPPQEVPLLDRHDRAAVRRS